MSQFSEILKKLFGRRVYGELIKKGFDELVEEAPELLFHIYEILKPLIIEIIEKKLREKGIPDTVINEITDEIKLNKVA